MKTTLYRPINVPIRLHLEYQQMTVGELSNILRNWQVVLRSAWEESLQLELSDGVSSRSVPTTRILTVSTSTENSLDLIADFAIHAVLFGSATVGPVVTWPSVVRNTYGFLYDVWEYRRSRHSDPEKHQYVYIRGRGSPEMMVPAHLLANSKCGERVERLWEIANSGNIEITVDATADQSDGPESPTRQVSLRFNDE